MKVHKRSEHRLRLISMTIDSFMRNQARLRCSGTRSIMLMLIIMWHPATSIASNQSQCMKKSKFVYCFFLPLRCLKVAFNHIPFLSPKIHLLREVGQRKLWEETGQDHPANFRWRKSLVLQIFQSLLFLTTAPLALLWVDVLQEFACLNRWNGELHRLAEDRPAKCVSVKQTRIQLS